MRILYVVKNMRLANGVTSYAMNYYRKLIQEKNVKIDFLVVDDIGSPYYDEIKANGSRVFLMPPYTKNVLKTIGYVNNLFKKRHYDVVHSHVLNSGSVILQLAKHYGVPVRIIHAHATQSGDTKLKMIRNKFFIPISLANANAFFACSKLAGDYLYGNKPYTVINNAVDLQRYSFDTEARDRLREEYSAGDKLIVTTVGRFTKQKNPIFMVDIVNALRKKTSDFEFWWFGNGVMEDETKEYAKNTGADKYIKFFGANDKVNEFYSAADVFVLPSLFEGLPVVGIEAQVSGIPCLMSDEITREVKITDLCEFIPIKSASLWAANILKLGKADRNANIRSLKKENYDIDSQYSILKEKYESLCEEKSK